MPLFMEDESGPMEYEYFYLLIAYPTDSDIGRDERGWIFSDVPKRVESDYCRADVLADRPVPDVICKVGPKHALRDAPLTEVRLHLRGTMAGPIIPCDERLLVNPAVNEQLRRSGLKGADTIRAKIAVIDDEFLDREIDTPEIYALVHPGASFWRRRVMVPPVNECPFCGNGPIICPECGQLNFNYRCPKCGEVARKHLPLEEMATVPKGEKAIMVVGGSKKGPILDASRWDGSDFCGGNGIVTRRAVDFLLRIHAGPFRAKPLRAYVGSCTPEQRERLETAKKLESVTPVSP